MGASRRRATAGEEHAMSISVNVDDLRSRVREVYRQVAHQPEGEFHFEMGRPLAERLGYPPEQLDRVPKGAIASFAGVGYHLHLADLVPGESVLDLGSGSGMDSFLAALRVGDTGRVVGIDMTEEQRTKAERLRMAHAFDNVTFVEGYAEALPVRAGSVDVVISNGVINLAADKRLVFEEIARVLRPGGRMAISDIVSERQLSDDIVCDSALWAACIGGAAQEDGYRATIEAAGLRIEAFVENPQYRFLSTSAQGASKDYGVKSVSLAAVRSR
jgi:arsenite methyltransferase